MPFPVAPIAPIPWTATPAVLWWGLVDWWQEVARVSHGEALGLARQAVLTHRHWPLRWLGALVLLGLLLLLLVQRWAAPALQAGALQGPPDLILRESALLAVAGFALAVALVVRGLGRGVSRLYRRGAPVWRRRAGHRP